MCQHVRSRYARSSEQQDRQAGVSLRVPGLPTLHRFDDSVGTVGGRHGCTRCPGLHRPRAHERDARKGEDRERERRRGRRGSRWARQAEAVPEDPREIGKPRWNVGGMLDRIPALRLRVPSYGPFVPDRWRREALGLEEARPPESVQPGSGGRRSGALGHGAQPCRVENGFYTSPWPQGGFEAAHSWESALFQGPFATSVQVSYFRLERTIFLSNPSIDPSSLIQSKWIYSS